MPLYLDNETTWSRASDTTRLFSGYINTLFIADANATFAQYQIAANAAAAGIEDMATFATADAFFEKYQDKHSYSALQLFFKSQAESPRFLRDFCAEIRLCFAEYDHDSIKIREQRTELFSSFNTPWQPPRAALPAPATAAAEPIVQQPTAQYLGPYGQGVANLPFADAWKSLMLAFMNFVYTAQNHGELVTKLINELNGLYVGDSQAEEQKLAEIIARAVCRYYYRFVVISEHKQADFRFTTNPYTCAWIGGSIVPSIVLSIPIAANFISTIALPLQIAFPGIFLALGILLSQFDGQYNHEQDLDRFSVATREQRYKARAEWMLGCAAVTGTIAQALTPVILGSYIAQLTAGGIAATVATLITPIGISLATLAVTYFIINQLQACGHVKYSPVWSIGKPMITTLPGCATICDFASRVCECFSGRRAGYQPLQ